MGKGYLTRGLTKLCSSCHRTFTKVNMDGVKLSNGSECPSCEAETLIEKLRQRRLEL